MPIDLTKISTCRIHPAIGIARVGDHPTDIFIGPENAGRFDPPVGGYKAKHPQTSLPAIKRQGARFRVFAFDSSGSPLGEVSPADAAITWRVHLVNAKAEWDIFEGRPGEELPLNQRRPKRQRNPKITDRKSLIIDGGERTVTRSQNASFDQGKFKNKPVPLGELRCGDDGRLVVLGGFGKSETLTATRIRHYANNDGWHDDVSDGSIHASVALKNGAVIEAAPAWAIVAPPDFAPSIGTTVTLWDLMLDVATSRGLLTIPPKPSFTRDIYPILNRSMTQQWVNELAAVGHGPGKGGDFSTQWVTLNKSDGSNKHTREVLFGRLRNPHLLDKVVHKTATPQEELEAKTQASRSIMPALSGDSGDSTLGVIDTWLTLTKRQYDIMSLWKDGTFVSDWTGVPPVPPPSITAEGLDMAALENSAGGPLFPGIECGWIARKAEIYVVGEIARLDPAKVAPGDLTKRMAVPWQADFFECNTHWWPSQRPDQVFGETDFAALMALDTQISQAAPGSPQRADLESQRADLLTDRNAWWPDAWPKNGNSPPQKGDEAMVERWPKLGYVVPKESATGTVYVSTEEVRP